MKLISNLSVSVSLITQLNAQLSHPRAFNEQNYENIQKTINSREPLSDNSNFVNVENIIVPISSESSSSSGTIGVESISSNRHEVQEAQIQAQIDTQAENEERLDMSNSLSSENIINSQDSRVGNLLSNLQDKIKNSLDQSQSSILSSSSSSSDTSPNSQDSQADPSKINTLKNQIHSINQKNDILTSHWTQKQVNQFQRMFRNFSTSISVLEKVDQNLIRPLELIDLSDEVLLESFGYGDSSESNNAVVDHVISVGKKTVRFSPGEDLETSKNPTTDFTHSLQNSQKLPCSDQPNTFYLSETNECRPQLDCSTIYQDIIVDPKIIANGMGKQVRRAKYLYNNNTSEAVKVAFVETKQNAKGQIVRSEVTDRISAGLENLLAFQGNKNILKVYGSCTEKVQLPPNPKTGEVTELDRTLIISDFCDNGDLSRFIQGESYKEFSVKQRVKLALSFLNTFKFLHNSPTGTRINCDMNALHRALTQFLVTKDFEVVLNDLDDVPVVSKTSRCEWGVNGLIEKNNVVTDTHDEIAFKSNFLAPEQVMNDNLFFKMYPEEHTRFDTEKIDVWKLPDMLMFLLTKQLNTLQASVEATQVLITVEDTLKKCKSINYKERPSVAEIVAKFEQVYETLEANNFQKQVEHDLALNEDLRPKDGPVSYNEFSRSNLIKRIMGYEMELEKEDQI